MPQEKTKINELVEREIAKFVKKFANSTAKYMGNDFADYPKANIHDAIVFLRAFSQKLMAAVKEEEKIKIGTRLMLLGNVRNPDDAVKAIKDMIYGQNPPDLNPNKMKALGEAEVLFALLKSI